LQPCLPERLLTADRADPGWLHRRSSPISRRLETELAAPAAELVLNRTAPTGDGHNSWMHNAPRLMREPTAARECCTPSDAEAAASPPETASGAHECRRRHRPVEIHRTG